MNPLVRNLLVWLAIGFMLMIMFNSFNQQNAPAKVTYTQFIDNVKNGQVKKVVIDGGMLERRKLYVTPSDGAADKKVYFVLEPGDPELINDLLKNKVQIEAKEREEPSFLAVFLMSWGPTLLLIGFFVWMMRQQMGGGGRSGGAFSFGKSKAKLLDQSANPVTFKDVAGCDEAKEEVSELVDFLRNPSKFQKLGGKIPRGVLMVGGPGCGKTLLARAIAGEAKVPFFSISGSDFVEMFVGVGAARVRDMFDTAKKHSPCIVFIDEIDAVGRHRGAGLGGGNDEREQTLNQLLVEMDGFEGTSGVIIIAATNRPDVLDPALLRPGRFDRQVVVPLPDVRGREQILLVHMRKVPLDPDVKADIIARGTPGFSGADLANIVNEAALFAARSSKRAVDMDDFERAKDKIMMGAERRSVVMTEEEKTVTAYHESGHAVVGKLIGNADPVHKVTIIPRGRALGVTFFLPEKDRYGYSDKQILARMAVAYGGRIAEEVFLDGQKTTGARADFESATAMARQMVTKYGMTDALGPMVYDEPEQEVFLGKSIGSKKEVSEETLRKIDVEVRKLVDQQYAIARKIIEDNRDKVEAMTRALLEYETLNAEQVEDIMQGLPPRPPKPVTPPPPPETPPTLPPLEEPKAEKGVLGKITDAVQFPFPSGKKDEDAKKVDSSEPQGGTGNDGDKSKEK